MKIKLLAGASLLTIAFAVPSLMAKSKLVQSVKGEMQSLQWPQSSIKVKNNTSKTVKIITVTWKISGEDENKNDVTIKASQTSRNIPRKTVRTFNYTDAKYKNAPVDDELKKVNNVELVSVVTSGASSENMDDKDKSTTFIISEKDGGFRSKSLESQEQYNQRVSSTKAREAAHMQAVEMTE